MWILLFFIYLSIYICLFVLENSNADSGS